VTWLLRALPVPSILPAPLSVSHSKFAPSVKLMEDSTVSVPLPAFARIRVGRRHSGDRTRGHSASQWIDGTEFNWSKKEIAA
jgi:hypothetical protein